MRGDFKSNKPIKHKVNERSYTLRAVLSYPAREALAGAIDGVAGAVVGTKADLSTGSPIPATWTNCKTHAHKKKNNHFTKPLSAYYHSHAEKNKTH